MLATLPFGADRRSRERAISWETYPQVCSNDRFLQRLQSDIHPHGDGWLSEGWFGLDQGLLVLMIEIIAPAFVWDLMRRCPPSAPACSARASPAGGGL